MIWSCRQYRVRSFETFQSPVNLEDWIRVKRRKSRDRSCVKVRANSTLISFLGGKGNDESGTCATVAHNSAGLARFTEKHQQRTFQPVQNQMRIFTVWTNAFCIPEIESSREIVALQVCVALMSWMLAHERKDASRPRTIPILFRL